jgi:hypothetical protein
MILNNEWGRMWKEATMVYFMILSWYLPPDTEQIHEKPPPGQLVSGLMLEPRSP